MDMRKKLLALLVTIAIGGVTGTYAATKVVSVELGIEASSDMLVLPSTNLGSVVLTCDSCAARSYQLTRQTTYFIGKEAVTLGAFGTFLRSGGVHGVMLFVKPNQPVVTRIVASAQTPS